MTPEERAEKIINLHVPIAELRYWTSADFRMHAEIAAQIREAMQESYINGGINMQRDMNVLMDEAVAEEREACAKIAEKMLLQHHHVYGNHPGDQTICQSGFGGSDTRCLIDAIRSRDKEATK
jgi:hypothetical protein